MSPRDAFDAEDEDASRAVHDERAARKESGHSFEASQFVKHIVYGGLDGIISSFALIAAAVGARLPFEVVLLIGFAILLADGLSMGIGSYLSAKAEQDHVLRERGREKWEYDNYPEGEIEEMVELYRAKGFSEEDARKIIEIYTSDPRYKEAFIDHMMVEELGYIVPKPEDGRSLWMEALATSASFIVFGSLPLWVVAAVFAFGGGLAYATQVIVSGAAAIAALVALSVCKVRLTREKSSLHISVVLMIANGALAAIAAYIVGAIAATLVGDYIHITRAFL